MTRIRQISISMMATLVVAAAVAAPASAYESVNAASHPASNPASSADFSTPNAILGSSNVGEPVVETSVSSSSTGFDWGDALIGAGGALGLVLLTGGAMVLVRHRRGPSVQPTV